MGEKLTQAPDRAKEKAFAGPSGSGETRELVRIKGEFPELAWLGEKLASIPRPNLFAADALVRFHGEDPRGPAVARALGISEQDARERELLVDVERRAKRAAGAAPPRKPLEERRKHVAVSIVLGFVARLVGERPRLPDGTPLDAAAAALLARTGVVEIPGHEGVERHPRARPRRVRVLEGAEQVRVEAELEALGRRDFGPAESDKRLPDGGCGATQRNRRRTTDARAQFEEQRRYELQHRQERLAAKAGGRLNNPAGVKPLPLHEGRKARRVAWEREEALRFLMGLPHAIRVRLFDVATRGGVRGRFSEEARLVYAFYAFVLWQAEAPRKVMRRDGFDRAIEGLCREALAVSFVWNSFTSLPYHANTISALARALEEAGLMCRESPNSQDDVYTGVTGWALYVYRLRNADQLGEMLRALAAVVPPEAAASEPAPSRTAAPS